MTAGIVLKWFKDEFCAPEVEQSQREGRSVYSIIDEMVENVPRLSNGLVLVPYLTGVTQPDNNPAARGVFFGVGLDTKRAHFLRSILESIAFMLRENVELIEAMGVEIKEIRSLGGGSKSKTWQRIKADINGKKIASMRYAECASLGAAILGGVAVGLFEDVEKAVAAVNSVDVVLEPDAESFRVYEEGYVTYKEVYRRLRSLFK